MTVKLRPCRALERMRAGETINCFKFNLDSSRAVELVGLLGFDLFWTDQEHTPNSLPFVERQLLAAKAHGMDLIVRVPRGSYSDLIHPLEMDAAGIMVPHVMSAEDAREIARMTKFGPIGRRPADGGNADGAFCLVPFAEYAQFVNANRMVIIQIEDPEAMAELDAIAAVPGIDMLFFGPGDYSCALGFPGQISHPEVNQARARVAEAARRHGKLAGTTGKPELFGEYRQLGYHLINIGSDVHAYRLYAMGLLDAWGKETLKTSM